MHKACKKLPFLKLTLSNSGLFEHVQFCEGREITTKYQKISVVLLVIHTIKWAPALNQLFFSQKHFYYYFHNTKHL